MRTSPATSKKSSAGSTSEPKPPSSPLSVGHAANRIYNATQAGRAEITITPASMAGRPHRRPGPRNQPVLGRTCQRIHPAFTDYRKRAASNTPRSGRRPRLGRTRFHYPIPQLSDLPLSPNHKRQAHRIPPTCRLTRHRLPILPIIRRNIRSTRPHGNPLIRIPRILHRRPVPLRTLHRCNPVLPSIHRDHRSSGRWRHQASYNLRQPPPQSLSSLLTGSA